MTVMNANAAFWKHCVTFLDLRFSTRQSEKMSGTGIGS